MAKTDMPAGLCNGTALRKASRHVSQLYDAVLAPSGLRATQRSILMHVARAGMPAMGALASALVLDRSALAHNLRPLERDGLVSIVADRKDRRSRLIRLTAKGERKLAETRPLWEAAQRRFETAFGTDAAERLRVILAEVASLDFATPAASSGETSPEPKTGQS